MSFITTTEPSLANVNAIAFPNPISVGGFLAHLGITEYLARREEKTSELAYGNEYTDYKNYTNRWIPNPTKLIKKINKDVK